jgi:chorismate mutase
VIADKSDRSIEDPAVIKQILARLQKKEEPKEFNPLPESRAPPQTGLLG